jgi:D-glycerate 3-kinase
MSAGTHDMALAKSLFNALRNSETTQIPQYDKSAFSGQGDRVPSSQWVTVNQLSTPPIRVIIFEGWCVGFRALPAPAVTQKQIEASLLSTKTTLPSHRLEDLQFVNEKLKEYDVINDCLDAFIHIDAAETEYVYDWRLQQEAALRKDKGTGMMDEQVIKFVDGYYPAYELYTEPLRKGIFGESKGRQLRLTVGKDRKVKEVVVI